MIFKSDLQSQIYDLKVHIAALESALFKAGILLAEDDIYKGTYGLYYTVKKVK